MHTLCAKKFLEDPYESWAVSCPPNVELGRSVSVVNVSFGVNMTAYLWACVKNAVKAVCMIPPIIPARMFRQSLVLSWKNTKFTTSFCPFCTWVCGINHGSFCLHTGSKLITYIYLYIVCTVLSPWKMKEKVKLEITAGICKGECCNMVQFSGEVNIKSWTEIYISNDIFIFTT